MVNLKILKSTMKYLFLMMIVMVGIAAFGISVRATESIVINQVYVNAIDTEAGGEAIELYNPSPLNISIGGYKIMTESSNNDVVLAEDAYITANSYYLIADNGWDILKDNIDWPNADHKEALTMYNTNSGIALANENDVIIDAVGWGDISGIEEGLYELSPITNPEVGVVLMRVNFLDTNNNSGDFIFEEPNFHNSSFNVLPQEPEDGSDDNINDTEEDNSVDLPIIVNLTNSLPTITSFNISIDDLDQEGYQIMPSPGETKIIPVHVLIGDNDGGEDIDYAEAIVSGNGIIQTLVLNKVSNNTESALFNGNISMNYYYGPGQYNLIINAFDKNNELAEKTFNYEYLSLVAFDIDTEQLIFEAKNKQSIEIDGDEDFTTIGKPTIKNLGNTNISLGVYSNNLEINSNQLQYKLANMYYNVSSLASEIEIGSEILNYGGNQTIGLGFKLMVEKYLKPDAYLANLNMIGVAS
jgi:hypothetical protein